VTVVNTLRLLFLCSVNLQVRMKKAIVLLFTSFILGLVSLSKLAFVTALFKSFTVICVVNIRVESTAFLVYFSIFL